MRPIILFDMDGTLTDSGPGITRCVRHALRTFHIEVENIEDLRAFVGPPLRSQFHAYAGLSKEDCELAVEKYRERYTTLGIYENDLYPGIFDLVSDLYKEGYRLAVASSKPQVFVERILKHFHLDTYFEVVVGSELDGRREDKAEVIRTALEKLKVVERDDIPLMVGDRKNDVAGAKTCQIPCIGVSYGYGSRKELSLAGADWIVDSVKELGKLIKERFERSGN